MNYPKKVRLVEVGPRDGLQNEAKPVPVDAKVALIDALSAAGHRAVEAGSFVSPKWVPQMANTDEVMARIRRKPGVGYPVLVPNKQGMNGAVEAQCEEIADLHRGVGGVLPQEHQLLDRRELRALRAGDGGGAEARHEGARLRLDRDRLPL